MTQEELDVILKKHLNWLTGRDNAEFTDLCNEDLRGLDLTNAYLGSINLSGADLRGADLTYADLAFANLSEAELSKAILNGTDLRDVNLISANLTDTDLANTNLTRVITDEVTGEHIISVQIPARFMNTRISYWVTYRIWTMGDFQGNLKEFKKYIEKKYGDKEPIYKRCNRAIEYILNEVDEL